MSCNERGNVITDIGLSPDDEEVSAREPFRSRAPRWGILSKEFFKRKEMHFVPERRDRQIDAKDKSEKRPKA
jgi:hypothetical protein